MRLATPWIPCLLSLVLGLALATGCAAKRPAEPVPVNPPQPPPRELPTPNREVVGEFTKRGIDAREAEEGVVIYLPTVYLFAFNSAAVEPEAGKQLRQIAELLNAPFLTGRRIIVEGHADGIGAEAYNRTLSEKRAEAVIAELVTAGIDRGRLAKRAFGKERPLEPNKRPDGSDNPEGRARNRRVALIVENPKS
jgi:outer membrane protein OmpA-like peptidoglycan-associated protein